MQREISSCRLGLHLKLDVKNIFFYIRQYFPGALFFDDVFVVGKKQEEVGRF